MPVSSRVYDDHCARQLQDIPLLANLYLDHRIMRLCIAIWLINVQGLLTYAEGWNPNKLNRPTDEYNVYQAIWLRDVIVAEAEFKSVKTRNGKKFFPRDSIKEEHFIETAYKHKHDEMGEGEYFHLIQRHNVNAHIGHKNLGNKLAYSYSKPTSEFLDIKDMIAFDRKIRVRHVTRENGFLLHDGMRMKRDHTGHEAHRHSRHIDGHLYNDAGGSEL